MPWSVIPVLKAYLERAHHDMPDRSTRPASDDHVTMRFHGLVYTLMVRPVDPDGHSVYMVLAVQYPHDGVAPSGKFPADLRITTEYGAEACLELLPWQAVTEQMLQLCD